MNIMYIVKQYRTASQFIINLKEKVSKATEESKMLKLRLRCTRVELDERYKVTSGGRVEINDFL